MKYTIKYEYDSFYKNGHIAKIYDENDKYILLEMGYTYKEAKGRVVKALKELLAKPKPETIEL